MLAIALIVSFIILCVVFVSFFKFVVGLFMIFIGLIGLAIGAVLSILLNPVILTLIVIGTIFAWGHSKK